MYEVEPIYYMVQLVEVSERDLIVVVSIIIVKMVDQDYNILAMQVVDEHDVALGAVILDIYYWIDVEVLPFIAED